MTLRLQPLANAELKPLPQPTGQAQILLWRYLVLDSAEQTGLLLGCLTSTVQDGKNLSKEVVRTLAVGDETLHHTFMLRVWYDKWLRGTEGLEAKRRRVGSLHIDLLNAIHSPVFFLYSRVMSFCLRSFVGAGTHQLSARKLRLHDQTYFSHRRPKAEVLHVTWLRPECFPS